MLDVLGFRPGDHERKKLKIDSVKSPKSHEILEEKVIDHSENGLIERLGSEIEGVLEHIERLAAASSGSYNQSQ